MSAILKRRREKDINLSNYRDHKFPGSREEYEDVLKNSTTLYVGNLSFHTKEEQIYELFGKCGDIRRVVVGLNRITKTPCGFCFIDYHSRQEACNAIRYINGTRLDDRIIRTDWDTGFIEGRQYGRGKAGGQIRDEYRTDFDPGRGGFGKFIAKKWGGDPEARDAPKPMDTESG